MKKFLTISACAVAMAFGTTAAQAEVKVGFMSTLSGPAAALGQDQYDGFMLALEHLGGKLGDTDTVIIKEDDQLKPEHGVQNVSKPIEREKVDLITGITFYNIITAIANP